MLPWRPGEPDNNCARALAASGDVFYEKTAEKRVLLKSLKPFFTSNVIRNKARLHVHHRATFKLRKLLDSLDSVYCSTSTSHFMRSLQRQLFVQKKKK